MTNHPPTRWPFSLLEKLRFPQLFIFTLALLAFDVLVPDPIPFLDELLIAAVAVLLGSLSKPPEEEPPAPKPPMKNVTPPKG